VVKDPVVVDDVDSPRSRLRVSNDLSVVPGIQDDGPSLAASNEDVSLRLVESDADQPIAREWR